ncbi:MAG: Fic family protein [Pseudomonadota bacterium]|nr:Fic family protein [Pseudomonadota bacterium]
MAGVPKVEGLKISAETLKLLGGIDEFKGAWRAIGRLAPERLSALRRVATIESIGSSTRIEGSRLTDREVERLLSNVEVRQFANRDEQEVVGYAETMETVFGNASAIDLTENHIRQLHRDLLRHAAKDERHRGEYKMVRNDVVALDAEGNQVGVVFETASPFDTPRAMTALVEWTNKTLDEGTQHPLVVIAVFIVTFLAIHPFQDGNGRLSRILTTLLLLRSGYAYVPYASLESVIESTKDRYYLSLRRTQQTLSQENPDWEPWLQYFLGALFAQKERLEKKLEQERLLSGALPELSVKILELCRSRGRITVGEMEKMTGANRGTIKDHLASLTRIGHLKLHGAGRGAFYTLA